MSEADEINPEDLAAAGDLYDKVIAPKSKPYTVAVTVTLYYEFDKSKFPPWANVISVTKMVEEAFTDHNKDLVLSALSAGGILNQNPVEISLDRVMEA